MGRRGDRQEVATGLEDNTGTRLETRTQGQNRTQATLQQRERSLAVSRRHVQSSSGDEDQSRRRPASQCASIRRGQKGKTGGHDPRSLHSAFDANRRQLANRAARLSITVTITSRA